MTGAENALQEPIMFTGMSLINNIDASVLLDIGVDRSFISHKFRRMINHKLCKLKKAYMVEVANNQ